MTHRHLRRCTLALLLGATLAACGGGGGSPGATGADAGTMPSVQPTVSLELVDRNGARLTTLVGSAVGVARATVTDSGGAPAANARVRFVASDLVVLSPTDGLVLTDTAGVALINVRAADDLAVGNVKIIASVPALGEGVADEITVPVDGRTFDQTPN